MKFLVILSPVTSPFMDDGHLGDYETEIASLL